MLGTGAHACLCGTTPKDRAIALEGIPEAVLKRQMGALMTLRVSNSVSEGKSGLGLVSMWKGP